MEFGRKEVFVDDDHKDDDESAFLWDEGNTFLFYS